MLMDFVEKNLQNSARFCCFSMPSLPFHSLFTPPSLRKIYVSGCKTRSFGLRKTVFRKVKHMPFESETYMFRKIKIAHLPLTSHPSPLITGLANCTRVLEKFATTGKVFQNNAVFVLKRMSEL